MIQVSPQVRRNARFLITGAGGFIGRQLVRYLRGSVGELRAVTRNRGKGKPDWVDGQVNIVHADLTRPETINHVCDGIDTVIHLASYGRDVRAIESRSEEGHRSVTVGGTRSLLEAALHAGVKRFIFASSVRAMGEFGTEMLDETAVARPATTYGRSKLAAEALLFEAGRQHGINVCALRFPLVYGLGVEGSIQGMITAVDHRWFPPLPNFDNKRSMVHVDDAIQAIFLAAENDESNGKTYIVTDGLAYSTRSIYEAICHGLGRPVPEWTVPIPLLRLGVLTGETIGRLLGRPLPLNRDVYRKLTGSAWYSSDKIVRELGYRPQRTLYDTLPEMIEEYRQQ